MVSPATKSRGFAPVLAWLVPTVIASFSEELLQLVIKFHGKFLSGHNTAGSLWFVL